MHRALIALLLLGSLAWAADEDVTQQDWYKKSSWTIDYAAARAESRKTGKLVLAYFTQPH